MSIFRSDDDFIYLNVPYCEFYIPMYYFDSAASSRFAEDFNDKIDVLGIFNVGIFENGKFKEMKTMNLPTMISIFVYDSEIRDVVMTNGVSTKCKVVKYLKNAKIMQSMIFEDDTYAKKFINYIMSGKLPSILPYSKMLDIWRMNQEVNGVHFGMSSLYLEMILAVAFRNPKNLSQKFAKIAGEPGVSDYDYSTASIRQICQYNSTFTALTFEDIDSMITSSLNKTRTHAKEADSPVEQVIKF